MIRFPKFFKFPAIVLFILSLTSSCVSREEIVYFQGLEKAEAVMDKQKENSLKIKPNDLLTISVSAAEQTAALPFNLPVIGVSQGGSDMGMSVTGRQQLQTYLVEDNGKIDFPVLGNIVAEGHSQQELAAKLKEKIRRYVQDPIVNVRLVNFQISVLGEVNRPGTFDIQDAYFTLPQALGMAGDLSIYGKRDNVLVMREINGVTTHAYLDLGDANVINSPYYYLQQNDVVYVEPNGPQRQSASYNRNAGVYISIASVLVSVAVLLTR
ncbi:polysaccharide biosynthesis/export family protein [Salegentibacter maritimus]|uniref:Polysaccharide biosynthesis/export family protein n=1 Tax=Salegentibacter maritimus TaxID=2794347 RepID=A0ABS0TEU9_9FLAO|nr:polysaccharide biosynthesis/export family protein [Salegentibacter maritimus]MBI6115942.1 polysaccharide biosynthesis/export family protein [Salegentibacter maritimus]MBI6119543.1 polysaccharide biosynthesis/export family protein [Salegentibacter maritimus]